VARRIDANGATDRRGHRYSSARHLSAELKNRFEFLAYFTEAFSCRASIASGEWHLINRKAANSAAPLICLLMFRSADRLRLPLSAPAEQT
jgi:hypothetical protein